MDPIPSGSVVCMHAYSPVSPSERIHGHERRQRSRHEAVCPSPGNKRPHVSMALTDLTLAAATDLRQPVLLAAPAGWCILDRHCADVRRGHTPIRVSVDEWGCGQTAGRL